METPEEQQLPAPDDLKVAAVAAACTVALSLVVVFGLDRSVSYPVRLGPLYPYFAYLFVSKSARDGSLTSVRTWSLLIVGVTLAILAWVAVGG